MLDNSTTKTLNEQPRRLRCRQTGNYLTHLLFCLQDTFFLRCLAPQPCGFHSPYRFSLGYARLRWLPTTSRFEDHISYVECGDSHPGTSQAAALCVSTLWCQPGLKLAKIFSAPVSRTCKIMLGI